ncbi:MAG: glycosyltransferase family 4 protein [Planctomycetota bacterium]|nr:glycosyltransferase family 4 protein [Planctomycetota bacterium]
MRILTIVRRLTPGGTERAAQNCSLAYAADGREVAVLAYEGGGPRAGILQAAGIPLFIGGGSQEARDRAVERAAAWGPEVVHIHRTGHAHPPSAAIIRRLKEQSSRRLPVIETSHFSRADRTDDRFLFDVHIQLSRWCMWKWQRWARGLKPPPLGVVVPHMVDTSAFFPAGDEARARFRAEVGVPEHAFLFGRLGQPNLASWSPILFRAFAQVAREEERAFLLVVGLPEALGRSVEALPAPIRRRVIVHPFLHGDEAVRTGYSALDCFAHASMAGESFGFVLLEALLCGTPVITVSTPARGNSQVEVVGHERGGLVATDAPSMAEAMRRMMREASLRRRLVQQGQAWIRREYAPQHITPRLIRLFELALEADGPEALRGALEKDETFITHVERGEIERLMKHTMGRVSLRDRLLLELGHVPRIHQAFVRAKRIAQRARGRS